MKCLLVGMLLFAGWLYAQAPPATADNSASSKSLADVARENKQNGAAKSRVLVTNDNLAITKGAIPDVVFEGQDNAGEIIKAIEDYRQSHTAKEAEGAIRSWYEKHDGCWKRRSAKTKKLQNGCNTRATFRKPWNACPPTRNSIAIARSRANAKTFRNGEPCKAMG